MEFLLNPELPLIKPDWPGNPHDGKMFRYPDRPFYPSFRKLLKWQFSANPLKAEKKADNWRPPVFESTEYLDKDHDFISWLGHASFLIQIDGVRMITDPVFSDLPFVPRLVNLPFPLEQLRGIDYILLSHDHRDHCDRDSLTTILAHNQPQKILAPLRLGKVIRPWIGDTPVEEAAWFQQFRTTEDGPELIFLPSRHWSRRGLADFNRVLWGSFLIRGRENTVYFGSDSGYAGHFADIGQLFSGIDYALLGIGAYRPDYMMQEIHTNPAEAFRAFRELNADRMIPMHYGTYDLSDEPISEPHRLIREEFQGQDERLRVLGVNEVLYI
ncbi:MBL fold metallo-hydrolase [Flavilitoribacter nigricans]|uniref:Metallo-beta-lactamase domain-containing protein n=1 Tax=Flavilitoribacter nigricans (strain ATCC 23147 / DSM 23189 / NBRC 102662 / NCIMB 1420 / SS-2) TaxID=1122177 RepID=A0A2D0N377_FLAN2|nr:MBL fold metallo-hydrolase [Flavilitoribacter nigricans]PHN02848.1 hypothetical protein CRP01_30170 [Flavilitoribacter nigricans DSM 23189 = NBRC 102662]